MAGCDEDTNILKPLTGITIMSDRYGHGHTHWRQERVSCCLGREDEVSDDSGSKPHIVRASRIGCVPGLYIAVPWSLGLK